MPDERGHVGGFGISLEATRDRPPEFEGRIAIHGRQDEGIAHEPPADGGGAGTARARRFLKCLQRRKATKPRRRTTPIVRSMRRSIDFPCSPKKYPIQTPIGTERKAASPFQRKNRQARIPVHPAVKNAAARIPGRKRAMKTVLEPCRWKNSRTLRMRLGRNRRRKGRRSRTRLP